MIFCGGNPVDCWSTLASSQLVIFVRSAIFSLAATRTYARNFPSTATNEANARENEKCFHLDKLAHKPLGRRCSQKRRRASRRRCQHKHSVSAFHHDEQCCSAQANNRTMCAPQGLHVYHDCGFSRRRKPFSLDSGKAWWRQRNNFQENSKCEYYKLFGCLLGLLSLYQRLMVILFMCCSCLLFAGLSEAASCVDW